MSSKVFAPTESHWNKTREEIVLNYKTDGTTNKIGAVSSGSNLYTSSNFTELSTAVEKRRS